MSASALPSVAHIALVFFFFCSPVFSEEAVPLVYEPALTGKTLVDELRNGGFVLYLRHAATERISIDRRLLNLNDCSTQRNLSVQGREQVREIGKAFRELRIPVSAVLSSPYCRCRDTAKLAFGEVRILADLRFALVEDRQSTDLLAAKLRDLLSSPPPPGTNVVIVSHTANLKEAVGIWPKPEGVTALFKPLETGELGYFGMVQPEDWSTLIDGEDD
jgi:phosphohistidine phosphatase SixA